MLLWFNKRVGLWLDAEGGLIISSEKPFDFCAEMLLLVAIFWKYQRIGWNTK